nr:glycosyltransferase family A protein [Nocardioides sp. KC13]
MDECLRSVRAQTHRDREWIVQLNGSAERAPDTPDPRIKVARSESAGLVGAAKKAACALAEVEILLELDHDDVLDTRCLALVQREDLHLESAFSKEKYVDSDWSLKTVITAPLFPCSTSGTFFELQPILHNSRSSRTSRP